MTDIADEQIAGKTIKGKTPGIPQAECPDFRSVICVAHEWVAWGNGVGGHSSLHVDPQNFSQQGQWVLGIVLGIANVVPKLIEPAITHPDVEIAIRAEGELTAFVVGVRLRNDLDDLLAIGIRETGVTGRNGKTRDDRGAVRLTRVT